MNPYFNIDNKELHEFFLSFNTTLCIAMALFIFLIMRNYSHIIDEETFDNMTDFSIKFIPQPVINLMNRLPANKEDELLPV